MLPVLPDGRPNRAEPVRGGAGNGCYGKSSVAVFLLSAFVTVHINC
ncbi:hypothetical protein YQ95_004837 [Salmonella enterica subsp. enterica]|nr:hypothetical protein [Salmonella enterica subsp. enterica serovar Abony]